MKNEWEINVRDKKKLCRSVFFSVAKFGIKSKGKQRKICWLFRSFEKISCFCFFLRYFSPFIAAYRDDYFFNLFRYRFDSFPMRYCFSPTPSLSIALPLTTTVFICFKVLALHVDCRSDVDFNYIFFRVCSCLGVMSDCSL